MTTNQYWFMVEYADYDEFDHELRTRKIFPRAAHEIDDRFMIVYFECNQEEWNTILQEWGDKYC